MWQGGPKDDLLIELLERALELRSRLTAIRFAALPGGPFFVVNKVFLVEAVMLVLFLL